MHQYPTRVSSELWVIESRCGRLLEILSGKDMIYESLHAGLHILQVG
jgi:hypothetical protein